MFTEPFIALCRITSISPSHSLTHSCTLHLGVVVYSRLLGVLLLNDIHNSVLYALVVSVRWLSFTWEITMWHPEEEEDDDGEFQFPTCAIICIVENISSS